MKFSTRKEQRKVNEVVSAILLPLLPHLKEDEENAVQTAIMILQETEIESEERRMITKGCKVIFNNKYRVSEKKRGKVYTVISEPYNVCGALVVKLDGVSGCYAVDGLTIIESEKV